MTTTNPHQLTFKDGTTRIAFDRVDILLKRPTAGVVRELQVLHYEIGGDVVKIAADYNTDVSALRDENKKHEGEAGWVPLRAPLLPQELLTAWVPFLRRCVELLGSGGKLPDDPDDWPAWLLSGDTVKDIMGEFTDRPTVRSAPQTVA